MKYERKWLWWTSRQRINQRAGPDWRTQPESPSLESNESNVATLISRKSSYDVRRTICWFDFYGCSKLNLYIALPLLTLLSSISPLLHCCCLFMLFDSSENAAMRLKSNKFFSAHRGSPEARAAVADALSGQHPSASGQLRLRLRLWLCLGVFKCRLCALIKYCFLFSLLLIPLRLCVAVGGN